MRIIRMGAALAAALLATAPLVGGGSPAQGGGIVRAGARTPHPSPDSLGARTVQTICLTCHTMQGPPKAAPPFAMVAARYRMGTASEEEAVARMVRWVGQPDAARSLLPPMMRERFGLMPRLFLPDSQVEAAARYVLGDTTQRHGPRMAGARRPE